MGIGLSCRRHFSFYCSVQRFRCVSFLSHDVAAPLTPTLQEVAGYINYSAQFTPHLKWKLVYYSL